MDVQITPADIIVKTLFGENQNPIPWGQRGALAAMFSQANGQLRDQVGTGAKRDNGGTPMVRIDYAPLLEDLKVAQSLNCDGETAPDPYELQFYIQSHRNMGLKIPSNQIWNLSEAGLQAMDSKFGNPLQNLSNLQTDTFKANGYVSMQLYRIIDNLIKDVNNDILTKIFAARGDNAIYGSNAVQPLSLGNPTAPGGLFPKLGAELKKLRRRNRVQGKFLVIGGDIWSEHLDYLNVSAPNNQQSIDYSGKYITELRKEADFFYDESIDSLLGQNYALILAPNMTGVPTFAAYDYMRQITNGSMKADNVSYGTSFLPIVSDWDTVGSVPMLPIDVMVKVETCNANDFNLPSWTVKPSINYEVYTTPTGSRINSGPLANVNGIFAYEGV